MLARIRLAVGARQDFLVTRINTGVFKVDAPGGREGRVRSAPDGFPDLIGTQLRRIAAKQTTEGGFMKYEREYWEYVGQAIAIETKAKDGRLSTPQQNWRDAFRRVGGIYVLAKSSDDVYAVLGYEPPFWLKEPRE